MASKTGEQKRMWGGRFSESTDELVQRFNASVDFDRRLALHDLAGSVAHATMLGETGILTQDEAAQIIAGLKNLKQEVEAGTFEWRVDLEDVHMNLEHALTERIGPIGGKLHTARSRNDQVATDFRLWLRDETHALIGLLREVQGALVAAAERHLGLIMPGYTHLQVAQPVLFSHHLLAYYEMFARDEGRLTDSLKRLNISPLGAGALAGTGFPIDRARTAQLLGFEGVARNSLDAVSDRDFAVEFLAAASLIMMHLSRLSEELILWSSQEFGFVTLPDSHTTGSSIMPQKKNPDVSELTRGKTGRVYGHLLGLLTTLKGLPLAYNKDLQEDKEGVFDTADTLRVCLTLTADLLPKLVPNASRMREAAGRAYSNATDLADYLARQGLPFREAHEVVGKLVARALREGKDLQELTLAEMRAACALIGEEVFEVLRLESVVNARSSYGGTALDAVRAQLAAAKARLEGQG
ncbi:argininosuccinate lyase [Truepera radiovictrix DSM 17093]|uniref:Argininosuccinate lyase n=2 Tax=Truepera TaxID=332248 RepID=D7CQ90_TRURR|nr:argininosuccinate lyase [Truepera radiovictrix DSM 17093]